jgi:hypothetical protein
MKEKKKTKKQLNRRFSKPPVHRFLPVLSGSDRFDCLTKKQLKITS